jgi:hypothetical protein
MLANNMLDQNTSGHNPFSNRRKEEQPANDHFRATRQWLNIIFMIGAMAGVLLYLFHTSQTVGIIVILASMVFKIIECALRFIK